MAIPINVNGEDFKSLAAFARTRGVTTAAVSFARKRGTLERLGESRPLVYYAGNWYYSQSEAARAKGITRQAVNKYIRSRDNA